MQSRLLPLALGGLAWVAGACKADESAVGPKRLRAEDLDAINAAGLESDDPVERCVASAGRVPAAVGEVVQRFCEEVQTLEIPGAAMAIALDGKRVATVTTGVRCVGKPDPVTPETRFAIGSLTKSMTAALLIETLRLRSGTGTDEAIRQKLDEALTADPASPSLRDLLDHRAGIVDDWERPVSGENAWRNALREPTPWFEPGEFWAYSNRGYAVVGNYIDSTGGPDYAEQFETRFGPDIRLTPAKGDLVACGHTPGPGNADGPGVLEAFEAKRDAADAWATPAGGALADVEALLAWAEGARKEPLLVDAPVPTGESFAYGLGVRVETTGSGTKLNQHTGSLGDGWAQLIWTDDGDAIAILANRFSPLASTTMFARRELFGVEETSPLPEVPDTVAGRYTVRGWSQPIEVTADDEGVRLDLPELGATGLRADRPASGEFRATWPLNGAPLDFRFVSYTDEAGEVSVWIRSKLFVGRRVDAPASDPPSD